MSTFQRARRRLQAHPLVMDAALAAGVLACVVVGSFADPHGPHGPEWFTRVPHIPSLVLTVIGAFALVFRRRTPMAVLAVTVTVSFVELVTGDPRAPVAMCAVVALYTVASSTDRPTTWRVGLLTMTVLTAAAMLVGPLPWYAQENIAVFAWTGMAAAAGDAVRSRRAFVDAMRERAERAERTREEEARRRVAEERLRIARDLHDVVAHHIALVNVQAGVAAHVMDRRPDQAKEALAHVREASRSALNELRATVGLLRQSGDPQAPTEPAPGLYRLDELVDTFRHAGLPVDIARSYQDGEDQGGEGQGVEGRGEPGRDGTVRCPLPAAVDLAAYRIIQEALTNVQKHAGTGAEAQVSVIRVGEHLEVTVLDDGAGARATGGTGTGRNGQDGPERPGGHGEFVHPGQDGAVNGGGHGLLGMRERVTALGGSCTAGPRYGGGFRVHAILPFTAGAEPARVTAGGGA
ncbi:two-component sensor histidine kinase [Streptomyces sp. NA04227]|uniref:sensor histidine kinase n=1 Tax=Streptomyces sp. NA04227 TaxID=2742136 RepID=UPI001591F399|nr:histidine kinase [Streptomyces sp. NA04227]QKW06068.1 two-component sensor histidine kinase [Streptomyces sp. NA04227]